MKNKEYRTYIIGLLLMIILAIPHFLDTKAGILESGNQWILSRYRMVAFSGIMVAAVCGFGLLCQNNPKESRKALPLETIFLIAALLFGAVYLYVLPPLSAPDEACHYITSYSLSNRLMGLPMTDQEGKVLIREEDWFAEDSCGDYQVYLREDGILAAVDESADAAKVLGQTLTEETYRLIHEKGTTAAPAFGENSGTAVSVHLPVATTPFAHVMPALGITLARILGLNSLGLLYLGRLMNLVFYAAVTWLAMRRLPFGKEMLFGVALLPMSIHLSASFSYDAFIMAGMFYFTACCLDLAYQAERVRPVDVLVLALVMAAVGPCKMVYAVLMGLCLLIPVRKFGGWGKWLLSAACVLGAWVIAMVLINGQTVAAYATETDTYIIWAEESGYSLSLLLHRPLKTMAMYYRTFLWQLEHYHLTMIGAYLGNVDPVLDVPYAVVVFFTCGLLGLAFRKPGENLILTGGKRIWIWLVCLVLAGALLFSMLLAWTPIGSKVISGVQGRYFLPFLPVLLMTLKNDTIVLTKNADRSILYLMCCANAYVLLRLFSIVSIRL